MDFEFKEEESFFNVKMNHTEVQAELVLFSSQALNHLLPAIGKQEPDGSGWIFIKTNLLPLNRYKNNDSIQTGGLLLSCCLTMEHLNFLPKMLISVR